MTTTLTYQLPEEEPELLLALNGAAAFSAIHKLDEQLRGWLKHGHPFASADEALSQTRELLHDLKPYPNIP